MKEYVVTPVFGEFAWCFSMSHARSSALDVRFSVPVRVLKIRVGGELVLVDDRDADLVECAERLGVAVASGHASTWFRPAVRAGSEVKIWIAKSREAGVTARARWSEVAG